MKAAVVIALVVVGGGVVVTPVVAEYRLKASHQEAVVRLMERPGTTSVSLQQQEIGTGLKVVCWVTGTALAAAGIYLAVRLMREGDRPTPPHGVVTAPAHGITADRPPAL